MSSSKHAILIGSVLVAGIALAVALRTRQPGPTPAPPAPTVVQSEQATPPASPRPVRESRQRTPPEVIPSDARTSEAHTPDQGPIDRSGSPSIDRTPAATGAARAKRHPTDPLARFVLAKVGSSDAAAEAYWLGAINDPDLPADERQDLIEDLNEDGISDPDNPGPADLPLIMNRIVLVESLAPFAMDDVNADAFAEAHKDLVNMYRRLTAD